jgi:hypothetical protein
VDNIKVDLREIGRSGMDLAHFRDQWRALMNSVVNIGVHKMLRNFLISAQVAASQEDLISMALVTYCVFI